MPLQDAVFQYISAYQRFLLEKKKDSYIIFLMNIAKMQCMYNQRGEEHDRKKQWGEYRICQLR